MEEMVKISNTPEESNNQEGEKLTQELIQQLLKQQDKNETSQLNLRLETSISNQIELQAKQEHTTKTEIIKDILQDFYNKKTITKGTFNIKKAVVLMIPKSPELLKEYVDYKINIVSSLKFLNGERYINPLDPQSNLHNTAYDPIIITQTNNILDTYDSQRKCYYAKIRKSEMKQLKKYAEGDYFTFEEDNTNIHRGLRFISYEDHENKLQTILVDLLTYKNILLKCTIINTERAIELAKQTNNDELITYINQSDVYNLVDELVSYNINFENLWEKHEELTENYNVLLDEYSKIKEENMFLKEENEQSLKEKSSPDQTYIKELETTNKQLTEEVEQLKQERLEIDTKIAKLNDIMNEYLEHMS